MSKLKLFSLTPVLLARWKPCCSSSHASATHLRGNPETTRTMRHFQVRKWSKPHCGLAKKALAHPFPTNRLLTHNLCGSPKIIPQNSLRDFCGSPKIIPQNSLRDFCGSPEIIPQNSLRDFCGSPKNKRHRVPFLVVKGNEDPRPCQRGREGDGRNGMPQDHKGRIWKFRSWKTERRR